jgi:hypothetical protein
MRVVRCFACLERLSESLLAAHQRLGSAWVAKCMSEAEMLKAGWRQVNGVWEGK